MNQLIAPPAIATYQQELAMLIQRHSPADGTYASALPELRFRRSSHISEPKHSINMPSLCVIAQGAKTATLAGESYQYDPATYFVSSVHLPIVGKITEATPQVPYLSLQLDFNADIILDIVKETNQKWDGKTERAILVNKFTPPLLDAVIRLVKLLDTPEDIPILAPLIIREILYRVLQGEQGELIKQFAYIGSQAHRISTAIHLINSDYSKPLLIEELAKEVNMSPSSLHKHFKKVTTLSPLQYQKNLRLQVARRMLLTESLDVADAGFRVGYESPSQFSREYTRMFGRSPSSDVKHLRNLLNTPVI